MKMPVTWGIDHAACMVVATAEGVLRAHDIEDYLDGVARAATLSYRKIFDMSQCSPELSPLDMMALGNRIRAYMNVAPMGPVAIVAGSDETYRHARLFETLAVADRPLKIFRERQAARHWLDSQPAVPVEWSATSDLSPTAPRL
jgi:hypothetical protein